MTNDRLARLEVDARRAELRPSDDHGPIGDVPVRGQVPELSKRLDNRPHLGGEAGQPLDPDVRDVHQARLSWDLGSVRVHDGPAARDWTDGLGARAATLGRHIAFGSGEPSPASAGGQALLAHELTHVVQQGTGAAPLVPQCATPDETPGPESTLDDDVRSGGLGPPVTLGDGTTIQLLTTAATVEEELPLWVPDDVRQAIIDGSLPAGVHRYPGPSPWGDVVVWASAPPRRAQVELYQEFPSDPAFYLEVAQGSSGVANILFDAYTGYNRDMAYFVDVKGLSPGEARNELLAINEEVFRLVIEASGTVMSSASGVSGIISTQRSLVQAVERTGFASARQRLTGAAGGQGAVLDELAELGTTRHGVGADDVAAAKLALASGKASKEQLVLLVQDAADRAWDFIAGTGRRTGAPANRAAWEAMQGACGIGTQCSTASLLATGAKAGRPVTVRQFQAGELVRDSSGGFHCFATVDFGDARYLVDTTFGQFVRREGEAVGRGMNLRPLLDQDEAMGGMATALMRDGFIELDDVSAGLYARAMKAIGDQVVGAKGPTAPVTIVGGKILNGSGAMQTEVAGVGRTGFSPAMPEMVDQLLEDADAAVTALTRAGEGDSELRRGLDRLLDYLYELE